MSESEERRRELAEFFNNPSIRAWAESLRTGLANRIFNQEEPVSNPDPQEASRMPEEMLVSTDQLIPPIIGPLLSTAQQQILAREGTIGVPTNGDWTEANGHRIRIADMSTRHIVNSVQMLIRRERRVWNYGAYTRFMSELNRRNDARRQGLNIEPTD